MIRVLQMIGSLNVGGSQAMIMNLYRSIDRERVQFDFILDHQDQLYYADEIRKMGGEIYFMPAFKGNNFLQVRRAWDSFFREHREYRILHSHIRSYASLYLPIAHKYGITTIVHSHSTSNGCGIKSVVKKTLQYPLRFQSDYFFSCSEIAGEWLFGRRILYSDKYYMLKNAIDLSLYRTMPEIREKKRREIGTGNRIVFGHVGRFIEAKNHIFLLNIFAYIHERNADTMLILMGDGNLRSQFEARIRELGLNSSVILLGMRKDVNELLQAVDCFVFPSKWEGLPVSVVEAQASGLPCFVSDTVTREVGLSNLVRYLPIDKGVELWGRAILEADLQRRDVSEEITNAGFNIVSSASWLTEFYESIWEERNRRA